MSILIGGHAHQNERAALGYRWLWRGTPQSAPLSTFNDLSWQAPRGSIGLRLTGANNGAIVTGHKGYDPVPFDCTAIECRIMADKAGSIECVIERVAVAGSSPGVAQPLMTSQASRPRLVSQQYVSYQAMDTWTTKLNKGDVLGYRVISTDMTIVALTIALIVVRTG